MADLPPEKHTRVRMALPAKVQRRFEALYALRSLERDGSFETIFAEALLRGLRALEIEAAPIARRHEIAVAEAEGTPLSPEEQRLVIQRKLGLAFGQRRQQIDRRDLDRPETSGRRVTDHEHHRRAFIQRLWSMERVGWTLEEIVEQLAVEGVLTTRGCVWTVDAIEQLLRADKSKQDRASWKPAAL